MRSPSVGVCGARAWAGGRPGPWAELSVETAGCGHSPRPETRPDLGVDSEGYGRVWRIVGEVAVRSDLCFRNRPSAHLWSKSGSRTAVWETFV